jgi:hypothetical protein
MQASTDDASEFVRSQARKALEIVAGGGGGSSTGTPPPRAGARFYMAVDFNAGKGGAEYARLVREALQKELGKLPTVTLSVSGGGAPSRQVLASRHLTGFVIDGTIQRLASSPAGGGQQIDCDLKAFVATFPERAIKMTTTEGASLQTGLGAGEAESGKRDCLAAAAEALRDDVNKFLGTQQ